MTEPWQMANIAGPTKALAITKPEIVVAMTKRARRPLLVVGHEAAETDLEGKKLIDYAIRIAEGTKIPVVATAHTSKDFVERNFQPTAWMGIVDITNRLQDSQWKGLDEGGQYDVVLFMGIPYYLQSQMLSTLKHFAPNIKTISLDRYHQPHATWSFPNVSVKNWQSYLESITSQLEGE